MRGQRAPDADIDLGLAVSALSLRPGQTRTCAELAEFCGVSRKSIEKIESKGLRKLRHRLAPLLEEIHAAPNLAREKGLLV